MAGFCVQHVAVDGARITICIRFAFRMVTAFEGAVFHAGIAIGTN